MRRDVVFRAEDGTRLAGSLHSNDAGLPSPGIVMTHGFSGVKDQLLHYADAFAEGGLSVLLYDHRGFGESEGSPRLEIDPARQISDWQDALTFALAQPELDVNRSIGIWGSSFAGGLAMVLAANDPRVRCVVSQIPHVSGHRNGREMFNVEQRARLARAFAADRVARFAGAPPAMIPVFTSDPDALCALPPAVSPRYIEAVLARTPSWKNEITLRSVEHMLAFEPAGWLPFVSPKPFLMVVGTKDACTFPTLQLQAFEEARQPKRLVLHAGGHFDTYTTYFAESSGAARDWFNEHLRQERN